MPIDKQQGVESIYVRDMYLESISTSSKGRPCPDLLLGIILFCMCWDVCKLREQDEVIGTPGSLCLFRLERGVFISNSFRSPSTEDRPTAAVDCSFSPRVVETIQMQVFAASESLALITGPHRRGTMLGAMFVSPVGSGKLWTHTCTVHA